MGSNHHSDEFNRRIVWKCRRGMVELDLLMMRFYENHFEKLSPIEKQQFSQILDYPDSVLYDWFFNEITYPREYEHLLKLIKPNLKVIS